MTPTQQPPAIESKFPVWLLPLIVSTLTFEQGLIMTTLLVFPSLLEYPLFVRAWWY